MTARERAACPRRPGQLPQACLRRCRDGTPPPARIIRRSAAVYPAARSHARGDRFPAAPAEAGTCDRSPATFACIVCEIGAPFSELPTATGSIGNVEQPELLAKGRDVQSINHDLKRHLTGSMLTMHQGSRWYWPLGLGNGSVL